jgi:hypothetical protein
MNGMLAALRKLDKHSQAFPSSDIHSRFAFCTNCHMKLRAGLQRSSAEQDRLELFRLARAKGQGHKCNRCHAMESSGGWMLEKSDATR